MPEQPEQPKSPILRLSQKKLSDMVEKGEVQIIPTKEQLLVTSETKAWERFLGKHLETPIPLPSESLLRTLEKAKDIGWTKAEARYLPKMELQQDTDIPGWKIRPNNWYWEKMKEGTVVKEAATLDGIWVIIDASPKPPYTKGKQMYEHDPFGQMVSHLRKEKKIQVPDWCKHIPANSRFGISNDELHTQVNPGIATLLGVQPEQVRLPKAIEFNILGNLAHPEWGTTTTWEWFEDTFAGGLRLIGGDSDFGGLAIVHCTASDRRGDGIGFRPLVAFSPSPQAR